MVTASGSANARGSSAAADWIAEQIHPDTHLLWSYDNPEEFNAWTYDQAVGVIGLLKTRKSDEAGAILNAMLGLLAAGKAAHNMTAFADGYAWKTGNELPTAQARATGPNAWMGLALLHGYRRLRNPAYLDAARDIAVWMIDHLLVGSGELAPAFYGRMLPGESEPEEWIGTEHQSDMLAFLRGLQAVGAEAPPGDKDWGDYANELESWMRSPVDPDSGLWKEDHYVVGYSSVDPPIVSEFNEVLDSQTWTSLAFDASGRVTREPLPTYLNGLDWLDENWQASVECDGQERVGFSKRTWDEGDSTRVESYWVEGMGGYALARRVAPRLEPGGRAAWRAGVRDLRCFQNADGGVLYSVLKSYFDSDPPPNDFPITDFSTYNNELGGEPGVFGDGDPDWANRGSRLVSWFYSLAEVGDLFDPNYVRSPHQSFVLVNDSDRSDRYPRHAGPPGWNHDRTAWNPHDWASFTLTLNPNSGSSGLPIPRDISGFEELRFWARAQDPNVGIKVFLHAESGFHFWPEEIPVADADWEQITLRLDPDVLEPNAPELEQVYAVGISFGNEVLGETLNDDQATLWVEDFSFYPTNEPLLVPPEYPDNWTWGSVAASGWFIFAQKGLNPFVVQPGRRGRSGRDGPP
jgi:hypothetical protein